MRGEIIAIGNELTSGRIVNTTSGFAAHHLFEAGFDIYAMHTIGDTPTLIGEALKRALGRVDFVLVTGGLGPTDDDLTTAAVSKALNRPTMPNLDLLYQIRSHLETVSGPVVSPLEKLAWLPQGAETLTANSKMSGFQLIHDNKPIFFLPGVPHQMQTLLIDQVLPRLASWYKDRQLTVFRRVYKIFGKNEMDINRETKALKLHEAVEIGYYPVFPDVHLSITVRGSDPVSMQEIFTASCNIVEKEMNRSIYAQDEECMESVVGTLLQHKGKQLSVAESCTGGLISHLLTSVPGSSSYFLGGVVSYANSMKTSLVGVSERLLQEYGAVSREVAEAMAAGMLERSGADIALSATGIAGPDGGSKEKPVGTVFIGMASQDEVRGHHFLFSGTRYEIQHMTAQTALDLLRRYLLK